MNIFFFSKLSHIVAQGVISLLVPDVVGIDIIGIVLYFGFLIFFLVIKLTYSKDVSSVPKLKQTLQHPSHYHRLKQLLLEV